MAVYKAAGGAKPSEHIIASLPQNNLYHLEYFERYHLVYYSHYYLSDIIIEILSSYKCFYNSNDSSNMSSFVPFIHIQSVH